MKMTGNSQHARVFDRFLQPHAHLTFAFGDDWFARKAEMFARFFGTPFSLIFQTIVVAIWMVTNFLGWTNFDSYPFTLMNLAFSLQAAYAAPFILLAQTRQADRDKAHAEADVQHREDSASASDERLLLAVQQTTLIVQMLKQNTELTETIKILSEKLEVLTREVHGKVMAS